MAPAPEGASIDLAGLLARGPEPQRRALAERIETLVVALDVRPPPAGGGALQAVERALQDGGPHEAWLALAVLTARLPMPAQVAELVRESRLDGPLRSLGAAFCARRTGGCHLLATGRSRERSGPRRRPRHQPQSSTHRHSASRASGDQPVAARPRDRRSSGGPPASPPTDDSPRRKATPFCSDNRPSLTTRPGLPGTCWCHGSASTWCPSCPPSWSRRPAIRRSPASPARRPG